MLSCDAEETSLFSGDNSLLALLLVCLFLSDKRKDPFGLSPDQRSLLTNTNAL
jgi:hypothetical protein